MYFALRYPTATVSIGSGPQLGHAGADALLEMQAARAAPPPSLGTAKRTKTVGSGLGLQVWGPTQQATRVPNSHAPRLLVMALAMRLPLLWGIVGCHYHPTLDRPTAPCHFGEMFGGVLPEGPERP